MRKHLFMLLVLILGVFATPALSATFQPLGTSQGDVYPYGISGDGSVVVGELYPSGISNSLAFQWTQANGFEIGDQVQGSSYTWAEDTSYDGSVTVGTTETGLPQDEGVRWTKAGGFLKLGTVFGDTNSQAFGVSGDGSIIVGVSFTNGAATFQAFRWTSGDGMVGLGSLPGYPNCAAISVSKDGSVIVGGCYDAADNQKSFRWTADSGMTDPGLPVNYGASKVSADGSTVTGYRLLSEGGVTSFKWTAAGGLVELGFLPGSTETMAFDLSEDGSIIVGYSDAGAFIWDSSNGIRLLKDVLVNQHRLDLTGWTLFEADAISDDGQVITGFGENPTGGGEAWVADIRAGSGIDPPPGDGGGGGGGGGCFISAAR